MLGGYDSGLAFVEQQLPLASLFTLRSIKASGPDRPRPSAAEWVKTWATSPAAPLLGGQEPQKRQGESEPPRGEAGSESDWTGAHIAGVARKRALRRSSCF
jgi:hypothetical protein